MPKQRHVVVARAYNKRGRLLASASNSYTKTHPLQAHFAELVGQPAKKFLHAEIAALIRAGDKVYTLKVERYNKAGKPVLAKPCPICQAAIAAWNVKNVKHT